MKIKISIIAYLLCFSYVIVAQSPQFTQFKASGLYLNPALSGTTGNQFQFTLVNRQQWSKLGSGLTTRLLSFDYTPSEQLSTGVLFIDDDAGPANLKTTSLHVMPTVLVPIAQKVNIHFSQQFSYYTRRINHNNVQFIDDWLFGTPGGDAALLQEGDVASYLNFSTGVVIYSDFFWAGVAIHDYLPDHILIGGSNTLLVNENNRQHLAKISFHGGVQLGLPDSDFNLFASINIRAQGNTTQMDSQAGFNWLVEGKKYNYSIFTGLAYRSFLRQESNLTKRADISPILRLAFDQLVIGYSYDATISKLAPFAGNTHELTLTYRISSQNWKDRLGGYSNKRGTVPRSRRSYYLHDINKHCPDITKLNKLGYFLRMSPKTGNQRKRDGRKARRKTKKAIKKTNKKGR